jgi:hypothetical protein
LGCDAAKGGDRCTVRSWAHAPTVAAAMIDPGELSELDAAERAMAGGLAAGDPSLGWRVTTLAIAGVTAAWLYVGYTRRPLPDAEHRLRMVVFFVGLLVLASALMLRQPLFFVFMIAGFFYASALRPLPLAVVRIRLALSKSPVSPIFGSTSTAADATTVLISSPSR